MTRPSSAISPGPARHTTRRRHRRVAKRITHYGDWDANYVYLWDRDWRLLETRLDNGNTARQYVWGGRYIDELVQVAVNTDPYDANEQDCDGALAGPNNSTQAFSGGHSLGRW